ncbi:hypothetical protein DAPPUDRAFT_233715 [Daphnia pulex]|uniref:Uncharacterized protein n=1 Tax=Daphnia pulex TaxID=6669 RepID=E9FVJ3_DAPPU|nr:hypothetical protein DAPPUDRAFT_233715 [Daphnia pulex]|eukprot:EFX88564.1 hypothetical protein DAPPUDRAFT_233715 [Daphnia pulex]
MVEWDGKWPLPITDVECEIHYLPSIEWTKADILSVAVSNQFARQITSTENQKEEEKEKSFDARSNLGRSSGEACGTGGHELARHFTPAIFSAIRYGPFISTGAHTNEGAAAAWQLSAAAAIFTYRGASLCVRALISSRASLVAQMKSACLDSPEVWHLSPCEPTWRQQQADVKLVRRSECNLMLRDDYYDDCYTGRIGSRSARSRSSGPRTGGAGALSCYGDIVTWGRRVKAEDSFYCPAAPDYIGLSDDFSPWAVLQKQKNKNTGGGDRTFS